MRRRVIDRNEGYPLHILFVCTGNVCRSPIAERLTAAYGVRSKLAGLEVSSAGTRAMIGQPIHESAAAVLASLGGDASNFAARHLSMKIASDADLILTMTRAHRDAVLELAPRQLPRVFTLAEASRLAAECQARNVEDLAANRAHISPTDISDVPDPIGRSAEFFEAVGTQIADLLPPVLQLCGYE